MRCLEVSRQRSSEEAGEAPPMHAQQPKGQTDKLPPEGPQYCRRSLATRFRSTRRERPRLAARCVIEARPPALGGGA